MSKFRYWAVRTKTVSLETRIVEAEDEAEALEYADVVQAEPGRAGERVAQEETEILEIRDYVGPADTFAGALKLAGEAGYKVNDEED